MRPQCDMSLLRAVEVTRSSCLLRWGISGLAPSHGVSGSSTCWGHLEVLSPCSLLHRGSPGLGPYQEGCPCPLPAGGSCSSALISTPPCTLLALDRPLWPTCCLPRRMTLGFRRPIIVSCGVLLRLDLPGRTISSLSLEGSDTGYIRPRILYVGRFWRVPGFGVLPVACPWKAPLDVARTTRPLRHGFF